MSRNLGVLFAVAFMNTACRQGGGAAEDFELMPSALTSQASSWGFEVLWATTAGTASSSTVRTRSSGAGGSKVASWLSSIFSLKK